MAWRILIEIATCRRERTALQLSETWPMHYGVQVSRGTIGRRLALLERLGLVCRPFGERLGYITTAAGDDLARGRRS